MLGRRECLGFKKAANIRASVVAPENKSVGRTNQKRQALEEGNGIDLRVEAIQDLGIKAKPHSAVKRAKLAGQSGFGVAGTLFFFRRSNDRPLPFQPVPQRREPDLPI